MQQGLVDVIGTTRIARGFSTDQRVTRLYEDYRAAEVAYFKNTGIFPIMHVLVLQKSAIEKYPDLPAGLFNLFSKAKQWAYRWRQNSSSMSIVWHGSYLEEEQRIFSDDPGVYGLEANAHVIEKFLSYCYDLGTSERRIEPKDLCDASTWTLREQTV